MDRRVIASGGARAARRRPPRVVWATRTAFDAADGAGGAPLKGGGSRTTGGVKALARCDSIARHAFLSLSADIRRAAPVLGEKAGLAAGRLAREESRRYRSPRVRAGVAQLVEQLPCKHQVGGSTPLTSSNRKFQLN